MSVARLAVALALLCGPLGPAVAPASASPGSGPTAVVTLGDSYISGEAGRWAGNSLSPLPGHDGTDRGRDAYVDGTDANGCHRSDVAEVRSATLPVAERLNVACSGGTTKNLFRASEGGQGDKGEPSQVDQLLALAIRNDVRMVVVSVGGNDLDFASVVAACIVGFVERTGPCRDRQRARLEAEIPRVTGAVIRAIDEIRAVMAQAGYAATQYRLVLQTYPSVMPRSSDARHGENDPGRLTDGCPMYDEDLDWTRDEGSNAVGAMVRRAAEARGAEWMDVGDLLQGHEVCSTGARQATGAERPPPARAEWGRMVSASALAQGEYQEYFHPNALGQLALGACMTQLYAATPPGTFTCRGSSGVDPADVSLQRRGTLPAARPRLRLRAAVVSRTRRRTCVRFIVSAGGRPVRGAVVRFGDRRGRTGPRGRTVMCPRVRGRTARAVARKPGYRTARRSVRLRARA